MGDYRVRVLNLASGERFPLLLNGDGQPFFEPTVYSLTELRARNLATNSISNILRAIQAFYLYLDIRQINFFSRLTSGQMLSLGEVEDLTRLCRLPMERLEAMSPESAHDDGCPRLVSLEKVRMRSRPETEDFLNSAFAGTRLRYIGSYLKWLVSDYISRQKIEKNVADNVEQSLERVLLAINARIPKASGAKALGQREGLSTESASELLRVASPDSQDNPWQDDYVRHRNALIVHWLYYLGLRRGELLGVKVNDIDFRKGTVTIHRRADDPSDPRTNQPQTKTKPRVIPLGEELKSLTYDYVMNYRSTLPGARKHAFLVCGNATGQPMSLPALNKVFAVLRAKHPTLTDSLCPHVLRHTWNDRFSELMDQRQVTEETEKKMRSYLMGWSETSGTAATYTRRHTRKKAQEASLKMQEELMTRNGNDA